MKTLRMYLGNTVNYLGLTDILEQYIQQLQSIYLFPVHMVFS